jgi:hypothetical protein
MQESRLLGTLLPSSPDFLPIVRRMREKFGLPEVGPDDEPIEEVFLDDEPVGLGRFRDDIRELVATRTDFLPAQAASLLSALNRMQGGVLDETEVENYPEDVRQSVLRLYSLFREMGQTFSRLLDGFYSLLARRGSPDPAAFGTEGLPPSLNCRMSSLWRSYSRDQKAAPPWPPTWMVCPPASYMSFRFCSVPASPSGPTPQERLSRCSPSSSNQLD